MPTRSEWVAWAAGLFEGEGCISLHQDKARMSMSYTDKDVMIRFQRVVGVGRVRGPYGPYNGRGNKARWNWSITKDDEVQVIAELFRPFLRKRRSGKLEELLPRRP